jgi:DNA-directed RNA polymerase subunit M/transcription elongation factor TFIIS
MTAKDEDILSSRTLLKKGVAIERFLENIIIDKNIKASHMLVGDRNAILIAARISGYGAEYETQVGCPSCGEKESFTFDLNNKSFDESRINETIGLTKSEVGNFSTSMPLSKFQVEFKLLTGQDEAYLSQLTMKKTKTKDADAMFSDQYKRMIVSVEGHTDKSVINHYVNNMPTLDSRHLRACYKEATPGVEITEKFICSSCNHEEDMEVPFTADFFWPDR